jgi:uncharacterized protein YcfJ
MFKLAMAIILLGSTSALAGDVSATVKHHYKNVWVDKPIKKKECYTKEVPVYGHIQREGNAAGGALLGMILGGVTGKVISGKDAGAAGGAVIGGLIGADQGSKSRDELVITGWREERVCEEIVTYKSQKIKTYSHSTIEWKQNGVIYNLRFTR